ncbi:hypothetical protein NP233_g7474 [Leucocoprinus birnbaumii]|uniref:Uncharacterized protein n=1 Tax=Leucocoprinus birnbaumii TaxID=56174 RepID=A0AAD5VP57_9AGAR|nr:hypothetical protein NP233_g7474 [Leucocoprinus birnbaumii]
MPAGPVYNNFAPGIANSINNQVGDQGQYSTSGEAQANIVRTLLQSAPQERTGEFVGAVFGNIASYNPEEVFGQRNGNSTWFPPQQSHGQRHGNSVDASFSAQSRFKTMDTAQASPTSPTRGPCRVDTSAPVFVNEMTTSPQQMSGYPANALMPNVPNQSATYWAHQPVVAAAQRQRAATMPTMQNTQTPFPQAYLEPSSGYQGRIDSAPFTASPNSHCSNHGTDVESANVVRDEVESQTDSGKHSHIPPVDPVEWGKWVAYNDWLARGKPEVPSGQSSPIETAQPDGSIGRISAPIPRRFDTAGTSLYLPTPEPEVFDTVGSIDGRVPIVRHRPVMREGSPMQE